MLNEKNTIKQIIIEIKKDIIFLENYNIYTMNNYYYFPQAEILLNDAQRLYNKYFKMCSILKNHN